MSTATGVRKLTLTTPSRGVQQWRDDSSDGTTRIAWASEGGRGLAKQLILLPVVPAPDPDGQPGWAPSPKAMAELKEAPATLSGRAHDPRYKLRRDVNDGSVLLSLDDGDPSDPGEPRTTAVPDDFARVRDADHLVVLLIYDDLPSIGEPLDSIPGDELTAIERFFGARYDRRLVTRGLLRLAGAPHDSGQMVFALASCHYPSDMTDGAPNDHRDAAPASASLLELSRRLTPSPGGPPSPSLLLLVGDQVYVDATAGIFDARSANDRLRLPYQNLLASPGAQSVFGLLPVAMMLDDHELADNWEPGTAVPDTDGRSATDPETTLAFLKDGKNAYRRFQRMAGPTSRPGRDALWCEFTHAGVPFFLADTRTERCPDGRPRRVDNWREARIMSNEQWAALRGFLLRNRNQVSFVASPAMLVPRTLGLDREESLALSCDSWDGFPASMYALLALICEFELNRVIFLSGDAHTSSVVRATVTRGGRRATFWSVHSSGLYCPYPFANDLLESYALDETFTFEAADPTGRPSRSGRRAASIWRWAARCISRASRTPHAGVLKYTCAIDSVEGVAGDGFATIALVGNAHVSTRVTVCFTRAHGNRDVCFDVPMTA